ncbi:hypothetical protein [Burkholderia multivorans]|uniref:hypothetical protein n=1 Tax=Burkholderia multivorans TaxID=87883 RepID=UPI0015E440B1|nr:hypothetical protein [Burkholderia multivorans]
MNKQGALENTSITPHLHMPQLHVERCQMGMMSPVFREINYNRIKSLKERNLSDSTVAGIVSDETGEEVSTQDITSYLKMNALASDQMLVSKETMRVVTGGPAEDGEPQPA